jgi:hypothetical protein
MPILPYTIPSLSGHSYFLMQPWYDNLVLLRGMLGWAVGWGCDKCSDCDEGVSFGDEVLADLAEAGKFTAVDLSVAVGIAVGILEAEDGEELVGGGVVDGVEGALGVVVSVEVVLQGVGDLLVGELIQV